MRLFGLMTINRPRVLLRDGLCKQAGPGGIDLAAECWGGLCRYAPKPTPAESVTRSL